MKKKWEKSAVILTYIVLSPGSQVRSLPNSAGADPGLLPAGSEEHEVLQTGSIHVAILSPCQYFTIGP